MREPDDLDAYLATLSEEERTEIAIAGAAIDLAILLYRAREARGLTQTAAAARAGLAQQAVSRFEQPPTNPRFVTLRRYLGALGYEIELSVRDPETGRVVGSLAFPPVGIGRTADEHVEAAERPLVGAPAS